MLLIMERAFGRREMVWRARRPLAGTNNQLQTIILNENVGSLPAYEVGKLTHNLCESPKVAEQWWTALCGLLAVGQRLKGEIKRALR